VSAQEVGAQEVLSTPEEAAYEHRAAMGAIWTGSRLVIGMAAFAFASLAFAYFYLRSINNQGLWRPGGVTASTALGAGIFAVALVAALLSVFATWRRSRGALLDWTVAGWLVVLAGIVAVILQVYELFNLHFYPGSSGYASCFVAWAVLNAALLLSGIYWTETILARELRLGRAMREDGSTEGRALDSERATIEVKVANHYWVFIGGISVIFWIMFYVM
jgi:heme/copper-type cytochrome/quinol oxidase subunit 3